jgi:F-type H+-transporting ATPase subunit alpha
MAVEEQVVSIFLGTQGHLDSVPVEDISRFEGEFLDHMRASHEDIFKEIRESRKLTDKTSDKLTEAVNQFKKGFSTTSGESVVPDEHVEALDEDKEAVKVRKPPPPEKK